MKEYHVRVNSKGLIDILSEQLYRNPEVYIRELLQNGVEAIVGREHVDELYKRNNEGRLLVKVEDGKSLRLRDNGLGMTENEIHQFLATIAKSAKKDWTVGENLSDRTGHLGIGLLSCFMVTDEICIRTKSIHSKESYEWIGRADGTYTVTKMANTMPEGTELYITAKEGCEQYYTKEKVEALIGHYGMILPYPILLDDGVDKKRMNPVDLPFEKKNVTKEELLLFGQLVFRTRFMDCIRLHSEDGEVNGVAYILPYSVQPSAKQRHLIYSNNMVLSEVGEHIIPDWAIFTKCILRVKNRRLNASREEFYVDEEFIHTREELGACISDALRHMAHYDKVEFQSFMKIHGLAIKSMALESEELYELFIDNLEFRTTRGTMTGLELRKTQETLFYCNANKYRQLAQIFIPRGRLLIDAGDVYDEELLQKLPKFYEIEVKCVDSNEVDGLLKEVGLVESDYFNEFLDLAEKVLRPYGCRVLIKQYMPSNLPAFYYDNEETFLYFNWRNPLVKKMLQTNDIMQVKDMILILYMQTLLGSGICLDDNELRIMNDRMLALMERGSQGGDRKKGMAK